MEPELILTAIVALIGVAGTLGAGLVPLRRQREANEAAWHKDRRADTYVDVLVAANSGKDWLYDLERATAQEALAPNFDQAMARMQVFASNDAMQAWRRYVRAHIEALSAFNSGASVEEESYRRLKAAVDDAELKLTWVVHQEINLTNPSRDSWLSGPPEIEKK